ncbi:FecR family protein [Hydrogenophaga sp.]|uniref:FecR family protein n=1 Tax=Hydrogenophaga sp. TaxID=1904254 RepID=UPI0025BCC3D2|nr:FecR family protein [Hydrogenophaga sp.]
MLTRIHRSASAAHLRPAFTLLLNRRLFALSALLLLGATFASTTRAQAATAVVEAVQLPAWVERQGQRRPAQPGQQLSDSDKAVTAEGARMLLRLGDRSVIKLGERTEFQIEQLAARQRGTGGPSELKATLRLITGVFRYATDYTSKALGNRRELNLKMATATVGIRGTDFWSMTDAEHDAVCVFEGRVVVAREQRADIALDQPGAFWVTFTGQPEQPPGQATPLQLAQFIDQADLRPGSGILLQGGRWRTVVAQPASEAAGVAMRVSLQAAGYPAELVVRQGRHEVRINQLATQADAQAVLTRLKADAALGVTGGRVALAAD